jgi:hypothetical protein
MRSCRFVLTLALALLPLRAASDGPADRATLRGITRVAVVVDGVAPDLQAAGLNAFALKARMEGLLRTAGVEVDGQAPEFVGIRLLAVHTAKGQYAMTMTAGLYQTVELARDRGVRASAATWEVQTVVLSSAKQLVEASLASVEDLAARFIAAQREANPKP